MSFDARGARYTCARCRNSITIGAFIVNPGTLALSDHCDHCRDVFHRETVETIHRAACA